MPALENRVARLEEDIDRSLEHSTEQALKDSKLLGEPILALGVSQMPGSAGISSAAPQIRPELTPPFCGDDLIQCPSAPSATGDVLNFSPVNGLMPFFLAPPSQPEGSWASGQSVSFGSYHPMYTLRCNQSPAPVLVPGCHLPLSVPPPTEPSSGDNHLSSHVPPPLAPATLTVSGQTPDSGAKGSDSYIATNDKPTSPKRRIGPDRGDRAYSSRGSKPYQHPASSTPHKTRAVKYEGNLDRLLERCRRQGADEGALAYMGKIFATVVSLEALMRPLTDTEVETEEFGITMGKVYTSLLQFNDDEGVGPRYTCRLCYRNQTWKHSKDALRHLRRDHFGLADDCPKWWVLDHSLTRPPLIFFLGMQCPKVLHHRRADEPSLQVNSSRRARSYYSLRAPDLYSIAHGFRFQSSSISPSSSHVRGTSIRLGIYHRMGLSMCLLIIHFIRRGLWHWIDCQSPLVPFRNLPLFLSHSYNFFTFLLSRLGYLDCLLLVL
jgi:hypothetical protein